jgi:hypothetical protein
MNVAEKVMVKKRDPHKACFDMDNRFGVYGDHEQEVLRTPFIISKIKSGELIEIEKKVSSKKDKEKGNKNDKDQQQDKDKEPQKPPQQKEPEKPEKLTVDQFKDLKADNQKEYLTGLEIEPGSNEDERAAQYEEWLGQKQEEGAE